MNHNLICLKKLPLIFVAFAFLTGCAQLQSNPPNILFFFVDDMGWQETSVPFHTEATELNQRYQMPHMETLDSEGVKFTQAYAYEYTL